MTQPIRIQRKRTKGWKMPGNTVYVGRPTVWGNPFETAAEYLQAWNGFNGHSELVRHFRKKGWVGPIDRSAIRELMGKNLACWCAAEHACHADVLLELANREFTPLANRKTPDRLTAFTQTSRCARAIISRRERTHRQRAQQ